MKKKIVYLLYKESISVLKEFNVKRHYNTKHASTFVTYQGQFCKDKLSELETKLTN